MGMILALWFTTKQVISVIALLPLSKLHMNCIIMELIVLHLCAIDSIQLSVLELYNGVFIARAIAPGTSSSRRSCGGSR